MAQITKANLQAVVDRINRVTNSPIQYFEYVIVPGVIPIRKPVINVNHYHLDWAYGGVNLCRTCNTSGGVRDIFSSGHMPKAKLYDLMHAYLKGFDDGQESAKVAA